MSSLTGRRCRGRRPRRPAEVSGGGRYAGGMNFSPTGYLLAGVGRKAAEGSRPLPTMQRIKGWQWRGSGPGMPGPYGVAWVGFVMDVGRPAPRPPLRLAAMRSLTGRRCRGRRPRRPAEVSGGGRYAGGMNFSPTGYLLAGVGRKAAEGSRPLPTMQRIKWWQWQGSVNGLRTRGAREGGSPPLCSVRRLPGNGLQRIARRNPPVT